jgi:hypothetical protein
VEVADFRVETDYDFAVDFENQPENTMGGRMLRAHVQDHGLV